MQPWLNGNTDARTKSFTMRREELRRHEESPTSWGIGEIWRRGETGRKETQVRNILIEVILTTTIKHAYRRKGYEHNKEVKRKEIAEGIMN